MIVAQTEKTAKMFKRTILVLSLALTLGPSLFAQKFTKREQARREAREAYYFCGSTFTLTAGYVHSWMSNSGITPSVSAFGKSERWGNTDNSYNLGFIWDQAFNKHWGLQTGAYFTHKGGDHLYYYDNELGYGMILRPEETKEVRAQMAQLQVQGRYFINIEKQMRLSLNVGGYVDKLFGNPDGYRNWNLGPQVGIGVDWKFISASCTYQPGVWTKVADNSKSSQSALCVNIGYRFWKK